MHPAVKNEKKEVLASNSVQAENFSLVSAVALGYL
jgi:hypothetical protein